MNSANLELEMERAYPDDDKNICQWCFKTAEFCDLETECLQRRASGLNNGGTK